VTTPITVLVADDEADLRTLVRAVVERAGFEIVEEAVDGDEALAAVTRLSPPPVPTVMVLDNQMPGLSGLEVAERVLAETPGQRIILFSAFLDANVRARAQEVGISVCLSKTDVHRLPEVISALAAG
jgi:CheY-like chemotaxis protein